MAVAARAIVAESIQQIAFRIPWFKHDRAALIQQYAAAFKKAALQADKLLETAPARS